MKSNTELDDLTSIYELERINKSITLLKPEEIELIQDGYHTFKELYEFRMIYNAALFNSWSQQGLYETHKSYRHYDGEECFGGGWFIVVAILPTGQISNHYRNEYWDLFKIEEVDKSKYEFDGHTGEDVINRLRILCQENI